MFYSCFRITLYSYEEIREARTEDFNLYNECGEIAQDDLTVEFLPVIVLRFFFLRLSDLPRYTSPATRKVYIYAQKVFWDWDLEINYSLLVRATAILVSERHCALTVSPEAEALDIDLDQVKMLGPKPDARFMKSSILCARNLHAIGGDARVKTAFNILQELASGGNLDYNHKAIQTMADSHRTEMETIERMGAHIVPYDSVAKITEMLGVYYKDIDVYRTQLNALRTTATTADFITRAANLTASYDKTAVQEAKVDFRKAMDDYQRSSLVLDDQLKAFNDARDNFENKRRAFQEGLEAEQRNAFIKGALKMVQNMLMIASKVASGDIFFAGAKMMQMGKALTCPQGLPFKWPK